MPFVAAHFVTLDRQDETSRAGVEVSKPFFTQRAGTALRFDVHGHWVDPESGRGLYFSAPVTYVSELEESDTSIGDVEVGGIYVPRFVESNFTLIVHGGVTLPMQDPETASRDGDASLARATDIYNVIPEGLTARLGVSPLMRRGNVFTRADLGVDVNLTATSGGDAAALVHANAGIGVAFGDAAVMVETCNLHVPGGWLDTGAVSARFDAGAVQPYAAFVLGLDDDVRRVMRDAVTVGIEARLP